MGAGPAVPAEGCSRPGPWRQGAPSDQGTVEVLRPAGMSSREASSLRAVRGHVGYSRVLTGALVSLTPWVALRHRAAQYSVLSRAAFGEIGSPLGQAMAGIGRRLAALSGD